MRLNIILMLWWLSYMVGTLVCKYIYRHTLWQGLSVPYTRPVFFSFYNTANTCSSAWFGFSSTETHSQSVRVNVPGSSPWPVRMGSWMNDPASAPPSWSGPGPHLPQPCWAAGHSLESTSSLAFFSLFSCFSVASQVLICGSVYHWHLQKLKPKYVNK